MSGVKKSTINERIQLERSRHGLSQASLALLAGVSRETQINYEKEGGSTPNCAYLARVLAEGFDVMFILTGKRSAEGMALEPMQRSVLDDFSRCSPEKQLEAVKYMALLAKEVKPPAPSAPAKKKRTP